MYYKDAAAAILVYDSTSMKSFDGVKFWVNELKSNIQNSIILAIASNKCDLLDREEVELMVGK